MQLDAAKNGRAQTDIRNFVETIEQQTNLPTDFFVQNFQVLKPSQSGFQNLVVQDVVVEFVEATDSFSTLESLLFQAFGEEQFTFYPGERVLLFPVISIESFFEKVGCTVGQNFCQQIQRCFAGIGIAQHDALFGQFVPGIGK